MAKPEPYRATAANIIYQNDATASFTRADWIGLALAALDQAGISPSKLADAHRYVALHVKFDNECDAVIADLFGELEI